METVKVFIKNMVCARCIKVVKDELFALGYTVNNVGLGEAEISTNDSKYSIDIEEIGEVLQNNGFELIDNQKAKIIEQIKVAIIELVHIQGEADRHIMVSSFLANKLDIDYSHLSSLFSNSEGITIERYLILQRIEKAKELLVYNELSLKEIAYQLGYSSVAHLSSQFKKITGLTPTHYKKIKEEKRKNIDKLF